MRIAVWLVPIFAAAMPPAHADCSARSAQQRPRLVELYTSEGCSSCPPAEQWLRAMPDDASHVALEFHVDYWDELGWPDPFADARYTARQRALAQREAQPVVYTPQVVVDGSAWRNWSHGSEPAPRVGASPEMTVRVRGGEAIRVDIESGADTASRFRTYLALTEGGLASSVTAGENRGRRLVHDHVVRDFAGPFPMTRANATLVPPRDLDAAHAAVVAFAEDPESGDVVQVVRVPLGDCLR